MAKECRFVEQYINNHFREEISLELLSEKAFMNKFYLVHAFKQYKGISPINYLIQLRIKEAKELYRQPIIPFPKFPNQAGFLPNPISHKYLRKKPA